MKWLKIIGLTLGVLLVLLVATYFVATSAWCLKSIILPRVSKATGATITVQDASISPFSSVTLTGLKVQTTGTEPLVTAKQVVARYSLMSIIGGNINVDEVSINDPVIRVVMNADGTSNLDPFTKKPAGAPAPKAPPSKPAEPPQIDVKKLAINNATILFSQQQTNGSRTDAELSRFTFTAANLKNGQTAKLALGTALKVSSAAGTNANELTASFSSTFDIALKPDLMPKQVTGGADLAVAQATGAFADAAQLGTKLAVDLSLDDIRQLSLNFTKSDGQLGAIAVSGPFDMMEREGKLKIAVTGIGYEVLSLVGGRFGIYFGGTKLAANYDVELKNKGQFINTSGTITADKFSLTRSNATTPVIDLQLAYNTTVDLPKTTATLRTFTFDAKQAGRPLITAGLTKEMVLDWGKGAEGVAESTLALNLNELNLADWKPFLGSSVTAGLVSGKLLVNVQKAGKQIGFDLDTSLTGLAAQAGSNKLEQTDVALALRGQMADFTKITLASLGLKIKCSREELVTIKGSGKIDAATMDADLETDVTASLVPALKLSPQPGLALSDGTVKFTGRIVQKNLSPGEKTPNMDQTVSGTFQLAGLTGRFASNVFDRFETTVDLNLGLKENVAQISKFSGTLRQANQPGGRFDVTGNFHLTNQAGEITLKLADLNQVMLRSFLAAALGERRLDSISISADTTAHYDAKGGSSAKGSVQVVNLLITDPKGQLPKVPLTAEVVLDAGVTGQGVAEIRRFAARILAADKPAGSFDVTGQYDLTNQSGQVVLKLIDLNQNALRPFLAPALGDKKLESVSIYADLNAKYSAKGDSAAKGTLLVTNLLVLDPAGTVPNTPLAAALALDASILKQILDLRQVQLSLAPTDRARNQLQLAGKVDMTRSNLYSGRLKLSADSLDFTPYYDMFAADQKTNAPAAAVPAPAPTTTASTQPAGEPPAVTNIPLRDFTFEAEIGKLFLREVAITGFIEKTRIDGGKVDVNPFQLVLNGAPVSAKIALDLGVPGYVYDVNFVADKIPLPPLVNSFQPARRGQISGTASATTQIKGAGITGPNLQKNLAGQFDLNATNLNLSIANVQSPLMKKVVTVIVSIPDLIRNPTAKLGSLLGSVTGSKDTNSTWVDQITQTPIDSVLVVGKAGEGKITLQQAGVQSPAFKAAAHGDVTLAPVLTNSLIQFPLEVSLRRSLAADVGLAGNTPTNEPYAKLPDFVTLTGTVGKPDADIKYGALAAAAVKTGSTLFNNLGTSAPAATGGIFGGLLGTGSSGTAPAAATPAVTTPTAPSVTTPTTPSTPTAPSLTNTNTSTNAPLLQNPLKGFKLGK